MSMISERVGRIAESPTLAVDSEAKALRAAGEDIIGSGAAELDFATPDHIIRAVSHATTERVRPADYTELDYIIYTAEDSYRQPPSHSDVLGWMVQAVDHHLAGSPAYARLAEARGFDPRLLAVTGDLASIPLISSGSFKRRSVATRTEGRVRLCTSSGTMGAKSVVPRDDRTLERFMGTILHGLRHFLGQSEMRRALVLGPRQEEAGNLWFSYSLSLAELVNEAEYFVQDERFLQDALFNALAGLNADTQPIIVTPPSLLQSFFDWMDRQGLRLDLSANDAVIITAGGWKRNESEAVDRKDLECRGTNLLGIARSSFRDVFNMVELNSLIFECGYARKHLPPWLHVDARSANSLASLPEGEAGMLAYLDPTPLSYPGFVLSDDLGTVTHERCPCGISGSVLRLTRRLTSIEERGCGLKMSRYQETQDDK